MNKYRMISLAMVSVFSLAVLSSCKAAGQAEVKASGIYPVTQSTFQTRKEYIDSQNFFDNTRILDIYFTIPSSTMNKILKPRYQEGREQVYALATEMRIGDMVVSNVGLRGRGRTSFYKINFKISFDSEILYASKENSGTFPENANRLVWGVSKLNLRASANDPTLLREQMATRVFEEAQAYSSRMGFARVYINGKYWGLYNTVEQLDENFIKARFSKKVGHLYKGGHPAKMKPNFGGIFAVKTKKKSAPKNQVNDFFTALDEAKSREELSKLLDIESVLNYLAAATLTGHWDSFLMNPNNDYIYRHSDGKWYIMAWDLDNTFGSGIGWGFPVLETSVYHMSNNENYDALFDKILAIPDWRAAYNAKIQYLLQNNFHPVKFKKQVEVYKKLIKDSVYKDSRKKGDWRGIGTLDQSNQVWEESFIQTPYDWQSRGFNGYDGGLLGWQEERWENISEEMK